MHHTRRAHQTIERIQDHGVHIIAPQRQQTDKIEDNRKVGKRKREVFDAPFCVIP